MYDSYGCQSGMYELKQNSKEKLKYFLIDPDSFIIIINIKQLEKQKILIWNNLSLF